MNWQIKNALLIWLILSLLGLGIIILIPESIFGSERIFTLSDQHGPTFIEATGLLLILIGWLNYLWQLWSNRLLFSGRVGAVSYAGVAVFSVVGCIIAAIYNLNWLIAGLALSALSAQVMMGRLIRQL